MPPLVGLVGWAVFLVPLSALLAAIMIAVNFETEQLRPSIAITAFGPLPECFLAAAKT